MWSSLVFRSLPLLLSTILAATLPEMFHKAKEQFTLGSYAAALETLQKLDAESSRPGHETERTALMPGLLFYRGASLAALGREREAQDAFEGFLAHQPDVRLDPSRYPRSVLSVFEDARHAVERRRSSARQEVGLAAAYASFPQPDISAVETPNENWSDGPVRALLTAEEKREFERLVDPVSRAEFVENFWKARDRGETGKKSFREEFARRVAFADSRFTEDEVRGSLTDRGQVFILMGPPSYSGRRPLETGEDAADAPRLSRYSPAEIAAAAQSGGSNAQRQARIEQVTGPGTTVQEAASNRLELWHYRRENLPRGIPYQEVVFQFVTKAGYGKNVLQRDERTLSVLERTRALNRRPVP